jgi:PAS domain S-box-containing protein
MLSGMTLSSPSSWSLYSRHPYAITVFATGLAGLTGLALLLLAHEFPLLPFYPLFAVILFSAWFGSFRHGLLAALLASLFANYYLSPSFPHVQLGFLELTRTALWVVLCGGLVFALCWLRQSQVEAHKVLASIAEGFCVLDANWNFVYINSSGAALVGMSRAEIQRRNLWETFPELLGTLLEKQCRLCARERRAVQFEHFSMGSGRVFQVHAYPVAEGISVFFRDISAIKEKEAKLRAIVERMIGAHKAGRIGTWEWNIQTNETFWSSEIPGLHAFAPEEFDGKLETCLRTVHPDDVPLVRARWRP